MAVFNKDTTNTKKKKNQKSTDAKKSFVEQFRAEAEKRAEEQRKREEERLKKQQAAEIERQRRERFAPKTGTTSNYDAETDRLRRYGGAYGQMAADARSLIPGAAKLTLANQNAFVQQTGAPVKNVLERNPAIQQGVMAGAKALNDWARKNNDQATVNATQRDYNRAMDNLRREQTAERVSFRGSSPIIPMAQDYSKNQLSWMAQQAEMASQFENARRVRLNDEYMASTGNDYEQERLYDRVKAAEKDENSAGERLTKIQMAQELQNKWRSDAKWQNTVDRLAADPNRDSRAARGEAAFRAGQNQTVGGKSVNYLDAAKRLTGLTDEQKKNFYTIYETNPEAAFEYAKWENDKRVDKALESISEWSGRNQLTRDKALLAGTLINLGSGLAPISSGGALASRVGQAFLGGGAAGLQEKGLFNTGLGAGTLPENVPIIGGKGLGDVYTLSSSMLQSYMTAGLGMAFGKVGEVLGLALMGSSAANNDYADLLGKGVDNKTAAAHAVAAGVAEALFEKLSIENFINPDLSKGVLRYWFQQAGIEASEEIFTSLANRLSDELIMDASGYRSAVEERQHELIMSGVPYADAKAQAEKEWVVEVLNDGLGGALSGGFMSVGSTLGYGVEDLVNRRNVTNEIRYKVGSRLANDADLTAALNEYAAQNNLAGISAADIETTRTMNERLTKQVTGETKTEGQQQTKAEKRQQTTETKAARRVGKQASAILNNIAKRMDNKTMREYEKDAVSVMEQNKNLRQMVENEAYYRSLELYNRAKDLKTLDQFHADNAKGVQDEGLLKAAQNAYRKVADRLADNNDAAARATRTARQILANGALDLSASYESDGETKRAMIQRFADDTSKVILDNGETRSIDELDLDQDTTEILQEIHDRELSATNANDVLNWYQMSVQDGNITTGYAFVDDFISAMDKGRNNSATEAQVVQRYSDLGERAAKAAYSIGRNAALQTAKAAQTQRNNARQTYKAGDTVTTDTVSTKWKGATGREGNVDMSAVKGMTLDAQQAQQISLATGLARVLGADVEVIASKLVNGKYVGHQGSYNNGKIQIDINAGRLYEGDLQSGVLKTMSHELTHFIQDYSPEQYQGLKDFAFEILGQKLGLDSFEDLVDSKIARSKHGISRLEAEDEVMADACETMLRDSKAVEQLYKQNATLADNILNWLADFVSKVRLNLGPADHEEAKIIDALEQDLRAAFQERWDNALADAAKAHSEIKSGSTETLEAEDVSVTEDGNQISTKNSLRSWTTSEQERVTRELIAAGFDEKRVTKWVKDMNSISAIIARDRARLDFTAADNHTFLKKNQDYIYTGDASTLCDKRRLYQGTFDAIQHLLPNRMITSDELIDLRNLMIEMGYTSPCAVCYVESRRRHLGKYAQQWIDSYEGEYKPTLDEVTTSDGLESLRHKHPQAYKDFIDAMKKKGSANPKVVELRTDYRGDITKLTDRDVEKLNNIGGLRLQSFSDFEIPHLLDVMQFVADMASKGLTSQAYTKVPAFARVFGRTGMKINLSLIAEGNGFDADGNLAFSSTEGMDINEALKLRRMFGKNVGTIIVGASREHILACMADSRIDFIIPFHRSGWGAAEMERLGMKGYEDFTYGQNEHDLSKPSKVVHGVQQYDRVVENLQPNGPDGYWDYDLTGKQNAEKYLELCAEMGLEPKFSEFLVNNGDGSYSLQPDGSTDGYWKTLIDFKMYDNNGVGARQEVVKPDFNMRGARDVMRKYEGGADTLPVAQDVVDAFVDRLNKADNEKIKYSYRGVRAKNADLTMLQKAEEMIANGSDSETVRQQTGWFKGMDGKWRFEIDDSSVSVDKYGDRNGRIAAYNAFKKAEEALAYDAGTSLEIKLHQKATFEEDVLIEKFQKAVRENHNRTASRIYKQLSSSLGTTFTQWADAWRTVEEFHQKYGYGVFKKIVSDYIDAEELFEAYPRLAEIPIHWTDFSDGSRGMFNGRAITLDRSLRSEPEQLKSTLLHELQHAVQEIEEFARGASPDYWRIMHDKKMTRLTKQVQSLSKSLDDLYADIGYEQYYNDLERKTYIDEEITPEEMDRLLEEYVKERSPNYGYPLLKQYKKAMDEYHDAQKDGTPFEMYQRTAGEIESRDVQARMALTPEQRRLTRPDIDRSDVVFAEEAKNTTQNGAKVQHSERDISEIQSEYEEALESGDPDWQMQLVGEAAYAAGYKTGAYHGSPVTDITVFNTRSESTKKERLQLLFGTHFTRNKEYAKIYARKARNSKGTSRMTQKTGRVYDVYLDLGKSLDLETARNYKPGTDIYRLYEDMPDRIKRKVPELTFSAYDTEQGLGSGKYVNTGTIEKALQAMTPKEATDFLVDHGYNSVLYLADYGTGMANNRMTRDPSIIMLDAERIKSADPVTYDDDGNVIPLSERFNPEQEDIRYSERDSTVERLMGVYEEVVASADENNEYDPTPLMEYFSEPENDLVQRLHDGDKDALKDVKKIAKATVNGDQISTISYAALALHPELIYRNERTTVRRAFDDRIRELMKKKPKVGRAINIENRQYSLDEVKDLFQNLNQNKEIGDLAKKVFHTAAQMKLNISFADEFWDYDLFVGGVAHGTEVIYQRANFIDEGATDQKKASILLHEMIHACVSYALGPMYGTNRAIKQRQDIVDAANAMWHIYNDAKKSGIINGEYGATNVQEFAAELSNPEFREKLRKVSLWDRIVDAIKQLFGIKPNNALDAASRALEYLLDNPHLEDAEDAHYWQDDNRFWEGMNEDYAYAVETGDVETAERLLDEAAKKHGYHREGDWYVNEDAPAGKRKLAGITRDEFGKPSIIVKGATDLDLVPLSWRFNDEESDARYSERDESLLSDNRVLIEADESVAKNEEQRRMLREYKAQAKKIADLTEKLQDARQKRRDAEKELRAVQKERKKENFQAEKDLRDQRIETFQARLARTNLEIDTTKKITELENAAKVSEKALAANTKALEKVERDLAKQLQREKDILAGKLKPLEMQRLLKNARTEAQAKIKETMNTRVSGMRENRKKRELMGRIRNLRKDLVKRMLRPTDNSYVPPEIAKSLVAVLDTLDVSPKEGTKAAAKYDSINEAVRAAADAYAELQKSVDSTFSTEYDSEFAAEIHEMAKNLKGRKVQELSSGEMQEIYDTVKRIRDQIRYASVLLNGDRTRSVYTAANSIREQQARITPRSQANAFEKNKRNRLLNNLSVMRAVEMMSGWDRNSTLYQMYHDIENGASASDGWVMRYNKRLQDLKTGKNEKAYRDAMTKQIEFSYKDENGNEAKIKDVDGRTVKMTRMQAIQLWLTYIREANNEKLNHLQKGGAVIRDALAIQDGKTEKLTEQRIKPTDEQILSIRDQLFKWNKQWTLDYAKSLREYFKEEQREANKVHYALKHTVLGNENFYFPIKVDSKYLEARLEDDQVFNLFVKTPGATNETKQSAPQPVIIDGADSMLARHVKEMGDYINLALPLRDFSKVYNAKMSNGDDVYSTVQEMIGSNFGDKGLNLIMQSLKDVQGGGKIRNWNTNIADHLNKLQGAFVRSALLINPSVTIKQAASYIAANSVLSHRALEAGNRPIFSGADKSNSPTLIAHIFTNPSGKTATRLYNEIDEHTSVHYIRRLGMSQTEIANEANRSGPVRRAMNNVGARMEQTGIGHAARKAGEMLNPVTWIQRMDVATTAALWVAAKAQAQYDGFQAGTQEYWDHVTELYEQTIRETQPMYDGLHRAAIQKSEGLVQYLFPFRTVPIQNHGQISSHYEQWLNAKGDAKKAAGKQLAQTLWANTMSATVFSLFTMVAALMKRKTKKYMDDDEEYSPESIMTGLAQDIGSVWVSNILPQFGSELLGIGERVYNNFTGAQKNNYDVISVGVVELANDALKTLFDAAKETGKAVRGEDSNLLGKTKDLLLKSAKLVGIPAETVETYYNGIRDTILAVQNGKYPFFDNDDVDRTNTVNANRYYEAVMSGDTGKAEAVLNEMRANTSGTQKEITQKVRSDINDRVKEAYQSGEMDLDGYISFLENTGLWEPDALADKAAKVVNELYTDGTITEDEAISLLGKYKGMDEDEAWFKVQEWADKNQAVQDALDAGLDADQAEDVSTSKYRRVYDAIDSNDDITDAVNDMVDHGFERAEVNKKVKEYLKDKYIKGEITEQALKGYLSRYLGITKRDEVNEILTSANNAIRKQKFDAEHPEVEWTVDQITNYYDKKPKTGSVMKTPFGAGISVATYNQYLEKAKTVTGTDNDHDGKTDSGSVKQAYIYMVDKIPGLSKEQKELLLRLKYDIPAKKNEDKEYDIPWHK